MTFESLNHVHDKILTAARISDPYIKRVFKDQISQLAGEDFITGIATMDARTQVNSGTGVSTSFMGYYVQPDISVRQEARFKAEVITGMLLDGQSTISADGSHQGRRL